MTADSAATEEGAAIFRKYLREASSLTFHPDWPARSEALLSYTRNAEGHAVTGQVAEIQSALTEEWHLPVVRLSRNPSSTVAASQFHPSRQQVQNLGRFSIRRLTLTNPGDGYIAVAEQDYPARGLWMMLHELGHVAHHWRILMDVAEAYRKTCLMPAIEEDAWASVSARVRPVQMEAEADLFAAEWLTSLVRDNDSGSLSRMGRFVVALERAVSGHVLPETTSRALTEIEAVGAELVNRHHRMPYPASDSVWERASWAIVNLAEDGSLTRATLADAVISAGTDVRPRLRRVAPAELADVLREDHWDPLVVSSAADTTPDYYIPIASIPRFRSPAADIELSWRHMMKPAYFPGKPMEEWLEQIVRTSEGLMVFARTPAERALDAEGRFRF